MSKLLRALLGGVLLLGIFIFALSLTSIGREAGFGNSKACLTALVDNPGEGVDALVLGSSRTRRAVDPALLGDELAKPRNSIANIGHPNSSLPFDYTVIDRASSARDLDFVLVEVLAISPAVRKMELAIDQDARPDVTLLAGNFDQLFLLSAPYSSQLRLLEQKHESRSELAWDAMTLFANRIGRQATLTLQGRWALRWIGDERRDKSQPTTCYLKKWSDPSDESQHGNEAARRLRQSYQQTFARDQRIPGDTVDAWMDNPSYRLEHWMIDEIVELGHERGFTPVFFYLPSVAVPADQQTLARAFQARFGAPLLVPADDVRAQLETDGYYDNNHLNTKGRRMFTEWIGSELRSARDRAQ